MVNFICILHCDFVTTTIAYCLFVKIENLVFGQVMIIFGLLSFATKVIKLSKLDYFIGDDFYTISYEHRAILFFVPSVLLTVYAKHGKAVCAR